MSTIFRMVKTNRKTQGFFDSSACINQRTGKIVGKRGGQCPNGYIDFYQSIGMKSHGGEDWACWIGEPIYFEVDLPAKWYSRDASDISGGLGVDVFSQNRILIPELPKQAGSEARKEWSKHNRMMYVKFRYWHISEGWKDKEVKLGELIAYGGNTGKSSGPHVHRNMKFVDKDGNTLDRNNGYYGAVNMREIFKSDNRFILDVLKKKREMSIQQRIDELKFRIRHLIQKAILILHRDILRLSTGR